jgi:hypothetical protein
MIDFKVICNKEEYLKDTLNWYNTIYGTDFEITNYIVDEVNFAKIQVANYTITDIFNIGYLLGVKEENLRQKGEIDW